MSLSGEITLQGIPLSEGYAVSRVCLFNESRHSNLPMYKISGEGVEKELGRIDAAIRLAGERIDKIGDNVRSRIGAAEAEIFVAQRMIMEDQTLRGKVAALIRDEQMNAETAVAGVLDEYEAQMLALDDEYIRERATDFGEVKRRLLDVLGNMQPSLQCAGTGHCQKGKNRIIVADELTPSLTVEMDIEHVMGFVTQRGGANSHAAILARAMGIPAVSGVRDVRKMVGCGTEVLVNGTTGAVTIRPGDDAVAATRAIMKGNMRRPQAVASIPGFQVMANINGPDDIGESVEMLSDGIGLYRTEMELLAVGRMLSVDEMAESYSAVVEAMAGKPVTFRLFDLGSDKSAPFLQMPREENPSLGLRGTRLLLQRRDILTPQARALAAASLKGPIKVMYPMIVDREQFVAVRTAFEDAIKDVRHGEIAHGTMFEVPAACMSAGSIMEEADFASIGTNDLIQYLFAVDRNNEAVADDYTADRAALWDMISLVARAVAATGKSLSICGEVASEMKYIPRLIDTGIRSVSVGTRRIPATRLAIGVAREERQKTKET